MYIHMYTMYRHIYTSSIRPFPWLAPPPRCSSGKRRKKRPLVEVSFVFAPLGGFTGAHE